jgi:hypothetical protein
MKLTHFALVLAVALCVVTAWLAYSEHNNAKGYANELALYKNSADKGGSDREMQEKEHQMLMAQLNAAQSAAAPQTPASFPRTAPAAGPASPVIGANAGKTGREALANSGHVGPAALDSQPSQLTPWQRKVLSAPAIGKVTEFQKQYGFVVITAGANKKLEKGMTFALRRGAAVIGRIKISDVEDKSAIGDLDVRSVPAGVEVEKGDEAIQEIPPEA